MADDASNSDYRPRCKQLCCKAMMVYGEDFESDPEYMEGLTEFWCIMTSRGHGPDGLLSRAGHGIHDHRTHRAADCAQNVVGHQFAGRHVYAYGQGDAVIVGLDDSQDV